jgi:probable HAF family extracellular repeat protein
MSGLQTLPGSTYSAAHGINNNGQIVGEANSSDLTTYPQASDHQAFVYDHGVTTAITVPNAVASTAVAINNNGVIAGNFKLPGNPPNQLAGRAFGALEGVVSVFPGQAHTTSVNELGNVTGWELVGSSYHTFLWDDAGITDLVSPADYYTALDEANGINNSGRIVGAMGASK